MHKFMRNCLTAGVLAFGLAACGDDVTITQPPAPPAVPNITSFSVAPAAVTLTAGQTVQASYNLQLAPTLTGTVAWISGTTTVATVDASGKITAVAPGTAVITATATSGGQTSAATIGVTVVAAPTPAPASISIASVTQGLLTLPVNLSNVAGQIEINLNFNPGGQLIDSVVSYIGNKRAAVQAFSVNAIPAAGTISMSVNTANYRKNFNQAGVATAGATQVDFLDGPTTINAIVFPKATTGQSAGNCGNAPPGVPAVCSSNTFSIVLNNLDSWAADMTRPTQTALTAAPAITYWGGPGAAGVVSATLYPVIYTPGRSITSVTWNIGGCPSVTQTALPFTRSFGYTAGGAQTACTYEWTGGNRDNVAVSAGLDNGSNSIAPFAGLIPNTVVFNSTPDSIRLDYATPTATALPSVVGAHGFNWVNATWAFAGSSATDAGVGMPATPVYSLFTTGANGAVVNGASAALAETNTNNVTDGYRLYFTSADRLGNVVTSGNTAYFGVDRTLPTIRYPSTTTLADVRTYTLPADTVTVLTAPVATAGADVNLWAVEAIDNRAGLFDAPASGSTRGVDQSVIRLAPGAIGTQVSVAGDDNYTGVALVDGYRQTVAVPVWGSAGGQTNATPGYYTYTATIRDRAGNSVDLTNATGAVAQRRYAIDPAAPLATGIGMPATFGTDRLALAGTFTISAQDDLEVIGTRIRIDYQAGNQFVFPASVFTNVGTRYDGTLAGAIATVSNLTTPVVSPVTTPDFWGGWQLLCGGACVDTDLGVDGQGEPVGGITVPLTAGAQVTDVFGTASGWLDAPILPTSIPTMTALPANTYSGGNVVATGIQVRYASGTTIRQVSPFSVTLPQLARLHAFRLIAGELVYQGTVQGSAGVGSDNGLERFWDYNFGSVLTPAGTYAIVSMYNGPVTAARGTALVYIFSK